MIGGQYVLAAFLLVVAVGGAFVGGYHERGKRADAEIAAIHADAEKKVAQARQQNAEVSQKVVTVYKDRIVRIREVPPEVQHDVQVIRESDCKLPAAWVRLHDDATGSEVDPAARIDGEATIPCAAAIEIVRENYTRSRENSEQLAALQEWAKGVSQ
jgi:hypothetical protein